MEGDRRWGEARVGGEGGYPLRLPGDDRDGGEGATLPGDLPAPAPAPPARAPGRLLWIGDETGCFAVRPAVASVLGRCSVGADCTLRGAAFAERVPPCGAVRESPRAPDPRAPGPRLRSSPFSRVSDGLPLDPLDPLDPLAPLVGPPAPPAPFALLPAGRVGGELGLPAASFGLPIGPSCNPVGDPLPKPLSGFER